MANNRMWLVHKPSGNKALVAKHFGDGWIEYEGPRHSPYYSIQGLFNEFGQDTVLQLSRLVPQ
jgi:hypothetical protein